jgi:outer membrane protein assembly factor BamB
MVALPDAIVLFTDTDTNRRLRMAVLGPDKGELRWERTLGGDDGVLFSAGVAVLVDRTQHKLSGLALTDGTSRWEQPDVKNASGTTTAVLPATTAADVSGPASVSGVAFAPDLGDDKRIVQVSADKSFRVLDAGSGEIRVSSRQGRADPNDEMLVHDGRFYVAESSGTTEVLLGYDLGKQSEPVVLYSAPANVRMSELTACGDRVCWVETVDFDIKKTRVASVKAVEGGGVWRRDLPNTDRLVPVGDHVLARQSTSPARIALLDAGGEQVWNIEGEAARLDGGNLLRFNRALSTTPEDPTLYGEHLGDQAVPLGGLSNVRSRTCSWNTSVIACVSDETFLVQRFAG